MAFQNNNLFKQAPKTEREDAQFWINIGYRSGSEDPNYEFVSLGLGIPLDHVQHIKVQGKNEQFRALTTARNELRDQLLDMAVQLQPGESRIFEAENGLAIQIRRVNEAQETAPNAGEFSRRLQF